MIPTVVVGAGGHGQDIKALIEATTTHRFVGFLDDRATGADVIGRAHEPLRSDVNVVVAVNLPSERHRLARLVSACSRRALVHPSAVVGPGCRLHPTSVVAAGAVLDRDVHLGPHVHVHTGATLTRTKVGAYTTVCPGANVCGDVEIWPGCLIGAGAVITNLRTVGLAATVGAGAVVVDDVPPRATVVGVPARCTSPDTETPPCEPTRT